MMNPEEYKQLRAYALYDGIYLAVMWAASFVCFLGTAALPMFGLLWLVLIVVTPVFVAYRLRRYRTEALGGGITFRRAFFYCLRVFTTASLLFALSQWAYMGFVDGGKLLGIVSAAVHSPEAEGFLESARMSADQYMSLVSAQLTPTLLAASSLVDGMIAGAVMSVFLAAIQPRPTRRSIEH